MRSTKTLISIPFSERFLAYCKVEDIGNGEYTVYLPNGKQNIYTYEKGMQDSRLTAEHTHARKMQDSKQKALIQP